jgi:hypothetical protein
MRDRVAIDAIDRAIIDSPAGRLSDLRAALCRSRRSARASASKHLLERLQAMLDARVLTRFGPMFQVERMGGAFVLAAMCVPHDRLAAGTRGGQRLFRKWPTTTGARATATVDFQHVVCAGDRDRRRHRSRAACSIEEASGLQVFAFPKLREYFRRDEAGGTRMSVLPSPARRSSTRSTAAWCVATQSGLPLVARPYHQLAGQLGIEPQEVMARMTRMLDCGIIRRIGAVPNHYAIGYTANGMSVWDVPDERIDELGARVGALDFVTHCYHRPRQLARVAVQPVCDGAWQFACRSAGQSGGHRRTAGCRLPGAYDVLFSTTHTQEDRPQDWWLKVVGCR